MVVVQLRLSPFLTFLPFAITVILLRAQFWIFPPGPRYKDFLKKERERSLVLLPVLVLYFDHHLSIYPRHRQYVHLFGGHPPAQRIRRPHHRGRQGQQQHRKGQKEGKTANRRREDIHDFPLLFEHSFLLSKPYCAVLILSLRDALTIAIHLRYGY